MKQSPTIGLIGCGLMGKAMASRLIAGGAQVWGYDPQGVEGEGIEVCASLADLAGVCEWIFYSLPNSKVALEVTDELLPHLTPKHAVADTTTGQPQETRTARHRRSALDNRGSTFIAGLHGREMGGRRA